MRATRGKTKEQYRQMWRERIEAFNVSGLTQIKFAQNIGVEVKSLQYWIKQFGLPQELPLVVPVQILPAQALSVKLTFNQLELVFDQAPSSQWLAALMVELNRA